MTEDSIFSKDKSIYYSSKMVYFGEAEKKIPNGMGTLTVSVDYYNKITLKGSFQNTMVTDAVLTFPDQCFFEGKVSFEVGTAINPKDSKQYRVVHFTIHSGLFKNERGQAFSAMKDILPQKITPVSQFSIIIDDVHHVDGCWGSISYVYAGPVPELVDRLSTLMGNSSYQLLYSDYKTITINSIGDLHISQWHYDYVYLLAKIGCFGINYSNGFLAIVTSLSKYRYSVLLNRPNDGGQIQFDISLDPQYDANSFIISNRGLSYFTFNLVFGMSIVNDNNVDLFFDNGNEYKGTVRKGCIISLLSDFQRFVNLKDLPWTWEDLPSIAQEGIVYYTDNTSYSGLFSIGEIEGNKLSTHCYKKGQLNKEDGSFSTYIGGKELNASTQKKYEELKHDDYYNIGDYDYLTSFKKTLSDLTVIEGKVGNQYDGFEEFRVLDGGKMVYEIRPTHRSGNGDYTVAVPSSTSFFKEHILNLHYSPTISQQPFTYCGTWAFPDGLTYVSGVDKMDLDKKGSGIAILTPKANNGDFAKVFFEEEYYALNSVINNTNYRYAQDGFVYFRKTCKDAILCATKMSTRRDDYYQGEIQFNNGTLFNGVFSIQVNNGENALRFDPRILDLDLVVEYSHENIVSYALIDGELFDASQNLIGAFSEGARMDDFEFARYKAKQKQIYDQKKAEEQKQQEEKRKYQELCNRYGTRYVNAANDGSILIGMHEDLVKTFSVSLSYESKNMKSYNVKNIFGETVMIVTINKLTHLVERITDFR